MSRFKLYIEYEGTRYSGWQKQKNVKTIQGILLNIAQEIFNDSKIDLQGSGRTDSGVHALCQVAHLEANTMLAPEIIKLKINDKLPSDINILEVEKTNKNFHARHNAVSRGYIYQISKRRTAFGKNFVWWIKDDLNFNEMKTASREFIGMHDFYSFAEKDSDEKSTKVLIDDIQIKKEGDLILIRIIGSHFLWKMVRRMVGVLAEIGRRKMTAADLNNFLITRTKEAAKYTAPPSGLFLEKVYYKGDKINEDFEPPVKFMNALLLQK
jgi:tRNA pseudouridine38-40 synthase